MTLTILIPVSSFQYLLEEKPFGPPPFLPSTFFIFGILIVAGIIIAFYNGEYKRHKNELLHAQDQLNAHETKKLKEGQDEEGNGYDVSDHSRIRFTLAEGGMTSANPSLTSKAKKYTPPPVSSALVDQHNSTDVNLVRVASSDGNSSNNRFSTITGSTSMWSSVCYLTLFCTFVERVSRFFYALHMVSFMCLCLFYVEFERYPSVAIAKSKFTGEQPNSILGACGRLVQPGAFFGNYVSCEHAWSWRGE